MFQSRHSWIGDLISLAIGIIALLYATQPKWLMVLLNPFPEDDEPPDDPTT